LTARFSPFILDIIQERQGFPLHGEQDEKSIYGNQLWGLVCLPHFSL